MRMWFTIGHKKVGTCENERTKVRGHKFNIMKAKIMLPEAVHYKRSLIFLDWKLWFTILPYPGMPATSPGTIGIVLMQEIAARREHRITKIIEAAGDFRVPGMAHRICYQCSISRPHIGVAIQRKMFNISVISGDNCAIIVNLST